MASPSTSAHPSPKKKITIFTPTDIKKIGLDKLITQPSPADKPEEKDAEVTEVQDNETIILVKMPTIEEEVVATGESKLKFCKALKQNLQKALDKKTYKPRPKVEIVKIPEVIEPEDEQQMEASEKKPDLPDIEIIELHEEEKTSEKGEAVEEVFQGCFSDLMADKDPEEAVPEADAEKKLQGHIVISPKIDLAQNKKTYGKKFKIMQNQVIGSKQETLKNFPEKMSKKEPEKKEAAPEEIIQGCFVELIPDGDMDDDVQEVVDAEQKLEEHVVGGRKVGTTENKRTYGKKINMQNQVIDLKQQETVNSSPKLMSKKEPEKKVEVEQIADEEPEEAIQEIVDDVQKVDVDDTEEPKQKLHGHVIKGHKVQTAENKQTDGKKITIMQNLLFEQTEKKRKAPTPAAPSSKNTSKPTLLNGRKGFGIVNLDNDQEEEDNAVEEVQEIKEDNVVEEVPEVEKVEEVQRIEEDNAVEKVEEIDEENAVEEVQEIEEDDDDIQFQPQPEIKSYPKPKSKTMPETKTPESPAAVVVAPEASSPVKIVSKFQPKQILRQMVLKPTTTPLQYVNKGKKIIQLVPQKLATGQMPNIIKLKQVATPNFRGRVICYKRKRAPEEQEAPSPAKKPETEVKVTEVKVKTPRKTTETIVLDETEDPVDEPQILPVTPGPKKRGRKSKAELALLAKSPGQEETPKTPKTPKPKEDAKNDLDSSVDTTPDGPPKKKRGRKSKAELERLAQLAQEGADDSDMEDKYVQKTEPTRHGRVPKFNKLYDNYVVAGRKSSGNEEPVEKEKRTKPPKVETPGVAKRPGRPRKVKPVIVKEEQSDDDDPESEEQDEKTLEKTPKVEIKSESEEEKEKPSPKAHNRRKSTLETINNEDAELLEVAPEQKTKAKKQLQDEPVRRKVGRPPKKRRYVAPDEDDDEFVPPKSPGLKVITHGVAAAGGRKRKRSLDESSSTSNVVGGDGVDVPSKRARPNNPLQADNVPDPQLASGDETAHAKQIRLLVDNLVKSIREHIATDPPPAADTTNQTPQNMDTCAICKQQVLRTNWKQHKQSAHNNLAWRTTDKPLDLDNYPEIMSILNALYPAKTFYCETCKCSKKSVFGFLGHKVTCGKSKEQIEAIKVACPECDKRVLPNSLTDHERTHRRTSVKVVQDPEKDVVDDGTPRKRSAARKAAQLIHQVTTEMATFAEGGSSLTFKQAKMHIVINNFEHSVIQEVIKQMFETVDENMNEHKCLFVECQMQFKIISDLMEHLKVCSKRSENFFICKYCANTYDQRPAIAQHLFEKHAEIHEDDFDITKEKFDDAEDEDIDDDELFPGELKPLTKTRRGTHFFHNADQHINRFWKLFKFKEIQKPLKLPGECPPGVNYQHYVTMLKFCKKYYAKQLFPNFPFKKATWFALNKNYIAEYLPRFKQSIAVAEQNSDTFQRYKLFESCIFKDGTVSMFCGGPITALAWAPTPFNIKDAKQMLAVAMSQDADKNYPLDKQSTNKSLIQLWNFGALNNAQPMQTKPTLELCIAHSYGGVFCMEWCPSGCYEAEGTRLGLLAVTGTDGNVYCYCIGHSNLLTEKVFKPKPIFKLVLTKNRAQNSRGVEYFATKISWSNYEGHKYIAVGYTNGFVGMFNVDNETEVLKGGADNEDDRIPAIYPYLIVRAHRQEITAISLYHLNGGNRWLFTSGSDRFFHIWDLHATNMKPAYSNRKTCALETWWPKNSLSLISALEDGTSNRFLTLVATHVVQVDYARPPGMIYNRAASRSVSGTDWAGVVYQGNEVGDVNGAIYRDLHPFILEIPFKRFLYSSVKFTPVEKNDEADTYDEDNRYQHVLKNYRVSFWDNVLDKPRKMTKVDRVKQSDGVKTDPAKYQMVAATVTCTNNNRFSFLYNAVGYNIGFVRVRHSNFLNYPS